MSYSDRYKKNTNKFKSANPVFEEWLSEIKEDAIAKDLQSKHTYSKCLNSLRKYPLPLKSGKECIILEGFGDKICKLIDEKLEAFLREGGQLHEEEDLEILSDCEIEVEEEKQVKSKPKKSNKKNKEDEIQEETITKSSNYESIRAKYPSLLKQSNKEPKKSAPKCDSWTRNSSDDEDVDKDQDEPVTKSKTVKKTSRSKEYMPEFRSGAYAILITLLKNEEENKDEENNYMLKAQLIRDAQKHSDAQFTSHDPKNHYTAWNSMSNLIKKSYVDKENKLPARYRLTESGRVLARKLLYGISENNENKSESDSESVIPAKISKSTKKNFDEIRNKKDDCIEILSSDSEPVVEKVNKPINNYVSNLANDSDSELEDIDIGCSTGLSQQFSSSKITDNFSSKNNKNNFDYSPIDYEIKTNSLSDKPNVLYSLAPGSFDIILFIDNCETNAKKQDLLIDEIKKANIKHEFGKLHVGDFAWIARARSGSHPDIVLNYIVERKRMDDLCSSIIDGRYKEQKFRLKKSGITYAVYLIEDYGSMKHMSLPEKSLVQADEMFAKCLMKIQGLSQEKVLSIVDLYPSPSHLIKEYSKCSDENSRIKLLANIKYGSAQRNVGPAIGKLVAQLFFTSAPLP
ncbi:unnamed protein product [Brachionus calyciflorus]|uniref:Crossover junction endonuclease MUS81 n=1 Tax=Brachionus calyciflorus TaxID=104777 RepID=A0A813ZYL5_9BILA|nr:unnamed protein product [Brachionus calyciflorus]